MNTMGPCCVEGCNSNKEGISFFEFPTSRNLRTKWLKMILIPSKIPLGTVVCSQHFHKDDYEVVRGKVRLKRKVVPTLRLNTTKSTERSECASQESTAEIPKADSLQDPIQNGDKKKRCISTRGDKKTCRSSSKEDSAEESGDNKRKICTSSGGGDKKKVTLGLSRSVMRAMRYRPSSTEDFAEENGDKKRSRSFSTEDSAEENRKKTKRSTRGGDKKITKSSRRKDRSGSSGTEDSGEDKGDKKRSRTEVSAEENGDKRKRSTRLGDKKTSRSSRRKERPRSSSTEDSAEDKGENNKKTSSRRRDKKRSRSSSTKESAEENRDKRKRSASMTRGEKRSLSPTREEVTKRSTSRKESANKTEEESEERSKIFEAVESSSKKSVDKPPDPEPDPKQPPDFEDMITNYQIKNKPNALLPGIEIEVPPVSTMDDTIVINDKDVAPVFIEINVDKDKATSEDCLMVLESVQVEVDPSLLMLERESDEEQLCDPVVSLVDEPAQADRRNKDPISLLTSSDDDDVIIEEPHIDTVEVSDETDEDDMPLVKLVPKKRPKKPKKPTKKNKLTKPTKQTASGVNLKNLVWNGAFDNYCVRCNLTFLDPSEFQTHKNMHQTILQVCSICSYTSASKPQFARHLRKHKDERRYKCHLCDYRARHNMSLKYHLQSHENETSQNRCMKCGFQCDKKMELLKHVKNCKETKMFACDRCDYVTKRRNDLKRHWLRRHIDTVDINSDTEVSKSERED